MIVNVGPDKPTQIRVVAEKIVEISGKKIKIKYDPSKPIGAFSRTANSEKVKAVLDWKPKIDLDEGLKRTYFWARKRLTKTQNCY